VKKNNSKEYIIGDKREGLLTISKVVDTIEVKLCLLSIVEPKMIS
jgi:hypothetical protein